MPVQLGLRFLGEDKTPSLKYQSWFAQGLRQARLLWAICLRLRIILYVIKQPGSEHILLRFFLNNLELPRILNV
jgi:hypothetical protein